MNVATSASPSPPITVKVATTRALYLTGESHAGHYIPFLVSHILARNDKFLQSSHPRARGGDAKGGDGVAPVLLMDVHGMALGRLPCHWSSFPSLP